MKLRRELVKKKIRVNMQCRGQDFTRKRGPKFKLDKEAYAQRFELQRTNGWVIARLASEVFHRISS